MGPPPGESSSSSGAPAAAFTVTSIDSVTELPCVVETVIYAVRDPVVAEAEAAIEQLIPTLCPPDIGEKEHEDKLKSEGDTDMEPWAVVSPEFWILRLVENVYPWVTVAVVGVAETEI